MLLTSFFSRILIPEDKANHVIQGALAGAVGASLSPYLGTHPAVLAQITSIFLGFVKELYDAKWGTGFSPQDWLATSLGGSFVAFLVV